MAKNSQSQSFISETENSEVDVGKPLQPTVSLGRSLGVPEGIAFLVGTIIASGILAIPKWVLFYVCSVVMSLVIWTICGIMSLFGA